MHPPFQRCGCGNRASSTADTNVDTTFRARTHCSPHPLQTANIMRRSTSQPYLSGHRWWSPVGMENWCTRRSESLAHQPVDVEPALTSRITQHHLEESGLALGRGRQDPLTDGMSKPAARADPLQALDTAPVADFVHALKAGNGAPLLLGRQCSPGSRSCAAHTDLSLWGSSTTNHRAAGRSCRRRTGTRTAAAPPAAPRPGARPRIGLADRTTRRVPTPTRPRTTPGRRTPADLTAPRRRQPAPASRTPNCCHTGC